MCSVLDMCSHCNVLCPVTLATGHKLRTRHVFVMQHVQWHWPLDTRCILTGFGFCPMATELVRIQTHVHIATYLVALATRHKLHPYKVRLLSNSQWPLDLLGHEQVSELQAAPLQAL